MARHTPLLVVLAALLAAAPGCSVKKIALNATIDALTTGTGGFGTDDDPELIAEAVPFGLKTLESLLGEAPEHPGLLLSLTSGFTQYAYAFVQQDGELVKYEDYDTYAAHRVRAHRLYRRALGYGQRGLEVASPGFMAAFEADPAAALETLGADDVALIYWTGAAWAGAISTDTNNLTLLADLGRVRTLLERGMTLDPAYDRGAFQSLFISLDMAPSGGGADAAKAHYQQAVALSEGHAASPHLSYAESVLVAQQDREGFEQLLQIALAIDPDEFPELRLVNILAQRRATYLLAHLDDLFGG